MDGSLPVSLKAAVVGRGEQRVAGYQEAIAQQQQIRAAIDTLAAKARRVVAVLTDPNLDPARWQEPAVFAALRRALTLLGKKAVVGGGKTGCGFWLHLLVTADPIAE